MSADGSAAPVVQAEAPDERIVSPLRRFAGAVPPAPDWFRHALDIAPERTMTPVRGAGIETLAWGERGRPGLLFLHGNGAHADWWSFIAPFFAAEYRVAAISWSGMGGSDWRERYAMETFQAEAFGAAEAAGLFDAAEKPVVVAHSFGAAPGMRVAATAGDRLRALVVVDSGVRPPARRWTGPPERKGSPPLYPTLEAALARFRLMPPQPCDNAFVVDHIGRLALRTAPLPDGGEGGGEGWTWRFDPHLWSKLDLSEGLETEATLAAARCPVAFVWGERSQLMPDDVLAYTRRFAPPGSPFVPIPDADHHVLLDQPLALVSALRALLEGWAK